MDRHDRRAFEHEQNFIAGRSRLERGTDVAARAVRVEVRAGSVQSDADQLNELARQHAADPRVRAHLYAGRSPRRDPIRRAWPTPGPRDLVQWLTVAAASFSPLLLIDVPLLDGRRVGNRARVIQARSDVQFARRRDHLVRHAPPSPRRGYARIRLAPPDGTRPSVSCTRKPMLPGWRFGGRPRLASVSAVES